MGNKRGNKHKQEEMTTSSNGERDEEVCQVIHFNFMSRAVLLRGLYLFFNRILVSLAVRYISYFLVVDKGL